MTNKGLRNLLHGEKNKQQRKRSVVAIAVASSALFCRCGATMLCCSQQKTNIVLPPFGLALFCSLSPFRHQATQEPEGRKQHQLYDYVCAGFFLSRA